MSVLIKGIEMPTSCDDCLLNNGITCYAVPEYKEDGVVGRTDDRPNWCPLIPVQPHGRLIDVDAPLRFDVTVDAKMHHTIVDIYAPTVIEAEEEE